MEPWETPALIWHSSKDYYPKSARAVYTKKWQKASKTWPAIPWDLSLRREPMCQTLPKFSCISSATTWVSHESSKPQELYHTENQKKKATSLEVIKKQKKRLTGSRFFGTRLCPIFLNIVSTDDTFQQSGNTCWKDQLNCIKDQFLKSS